MKYLIISSHPYKGSFNAAIANGIKEKIMQNGDDVKHIDLIEDNFNPSMDSEDLRLWVSGKSKDKLVAEYQKAIEASDVLIFPFPVWWGVMPAVLKGFCDKVLLPGWAYNCEADGKMTGLLNSKKAVVISTMDTPAEIFNGQFNDPVEGAFIKITLEVCGIKVLKYFQIDKIISKRPEYTESKLKEIIEFFE